VVDAAAPSPKAIEAADQGLRKAGLPDIDPFWVSWGYFKQQHAKAPPKSGASGKGKQEPKP
jgi:hypothetical protein